VGQRNRMLAVIATIMVAVCGVIFLIYQRTPPYTFDPTCTYDLTYRLDVTMEVAGKQYSSDVVHQLSRSRQWIQAMNYAGCQQTYGTAVSFRLEDNRLVLMGAGICDNARRALAGSDAAFREGNFSQAMKEHRKIDVTSFCIGPWNRSPSGLKVDPYVMNIRIYNVFFIDNADSPAQWSGFSFDSNSSVPEEQLRIVSATAEAADISPRDNLAKVAPAVLKTQFSPGESSNSPEVLLSFQRRYGDEKQFTYYAVQR
jgi:hypothetical protein